MKRLKTTKNVSNETHQKVELETNDIDVKTLKDKKI